MMCTSRKDSAIIKAERDVRAARVSLYKPRNQQNNIVEENPYEINTLKEKECVAITRDILTEQL